MFSFSVSALRAPVVLRGTAIMLAAAGVGLWGALLLAPQPGALPPALTAPPPAQGDSAVLAQWFGASASPIKVVVVGLIAAGERGAALLRVENAPAQAYRVGQEIGQGVTLARVERNAVVLDSGGVELRAAVPEAAPLGSPGFVIAR